MPSDRRKRDEDSMHRGDGKVRLKRVGNREREDKKRKARKSLITSEKKEKEKRKHEKK